MIRTKPIEMSVNQTASKNWMEKEKKAIVEMKKLMCDLCDARIYRQNQHIE